MPEWYLIYTKPRNEELVCDKLRGCGFEVFNPKLRERKYVRRKLRHVVSSLFPCYVFVRFEIPKSYRLIKYTRGVRKIVGSDHTPTPVHTAIIDSIRKRMEDGIVTIKTPMFVKGEEVVIKGGPFQGLDAIFEREMKGVERVSILLKTLNVRVTLDGAFLAKG